MSGSSRFALLLVFALAFALAWSSASAVRTRQRRIPEKDVQTEIEAQELDRRVKDVLATLETDASVLFDQFVRDHNKVYENEKEREYRFRVFQANIQVAKDLNARRVHTVDAVYGITRFSDMSQSEFKSKMSMKQQIPTQQDQQDIPAEWEELSKLEEPINWSWWEKGKVTKVKDQGDVGTCWAFSAVANIEGQLAIKHNLTKAIDLSVEQVVDCDGTMFPQNGTGDCGVNGGNAVYAYSYIQRQGGLMLWNEYPYCMGLSLCAPCPPDTYNQTICGPPPSCKKSDNCRFDASKVVTKVTGYHTNVAGHDEGMLPRFLVHIGPLSIAIDASALQYYIFGQIPEEFCSSDPKKADHAVLLTGYGTWVDIFQTQFPYWEVKNSWGDSWGEEGYFRLTRGWNTCGMNNFVTTAFIE